MDCFFEPLVLENVHLRIFVDPACLLNLETIAARQKILFCKEAEMGNRLALYTILNRTVVDPQTPVHDR